MASFLQDIASLALATLIMAMLLAEALARLMPAQVFAG